MKTHTFAALATAALLAIGLPLQALAAEPTIQIDVSPQTSEFLNGSTRWVDLIGSYIGDGNILGGAATLSFDASKLQVLNVMVTAPSDVASQVGTIDNTAGTVTGIGFATFMGVKGTFNFAKIEFMAIGAGVANLSLADANDPVFVWVNEAIELPTYIKTSSSLSVTAVPEPASLALLLAGLGAVGFVARRKTPV